MSFDGFSIRLNPPIIGVGVGIIGEGFGGNGMGVTYESIFDFVTVGIIVDDISGLDTTVNADVDVDVDVDIDFAMSYLY